MHFLFIVCFSEQFLEVATSCYLLSAEIWMRVVQAGGTTDQCHQTITGG